MGLGAAGTALEVVFEGGHMQACRHTEEMEYAAGETDRLESGGAWVGWRDEDLIEGR